MELKARLKRALLYARGFTDQVLAEITMAEDWIRRPVPGANHALWIAGHLAYATNGFVGFVDPDSRLSRDDLASLFGKGTVPQDSLSAYPPPSEITALLTERGNAFVAALDRCTAQDLEREVTSGPAFMYDVASVFHMGVMHEALHAGQLTVIHRMLGQVPLTDR